MTDSFVRAKTLSRRLGRALAFVLAILALVFLWLAADAFSGAVHLSALVSRAYDPPTPFAASPLQAALLLIVAAIQFSLVAGALQSLRRTFMVIAAAVSLPPLAAAHARRSGLTFLAAGIAMILAHPLNALVMSIDAPPGSRFIALSASTGEMLALVASGALIVFAHVMAVAAAIDAENREFV